jgi:kinase-associated protein B
LQYQVGEYVTFPYKTGKYIGKVLEINDDRSLVSVAAVLKHPVQGDLHAPKKTEVSFFHERKALAYQEKVRLLHALIKKYDGEILNYKKSLLTAINSYKEEIKEKDDEWARSSIQCLESLSKDYLKL